MPNHKPQRGAKVWNRKKKTAPGHGWDGKARDCLPWTIVIQSLNRENPRNECAQDHVNEHPQVTGGELWA